MTEPEPTTQAPLWGLRCGDELHRGHRQVYVQSRSRHQVESLAKGRTCYRLVVSHDAGKTWEAADA